MSPSQKCCHSLSNGPTRRVLPLKNDRHHGQGSVKGLYTTTSDADRIVYVPVGLDGIDGLPDGGGTGLVGLGVVAPELTSVLFAMMKAASEPEAWKTVPTKPLKWQVPLS